MYETNRVRLTEHNVTGEKSLYLKYIQVVE